MHVGFFVDRAGDAVWLSSSAPTQQQLVDFIAENHAKIRTLTIANDGIETPNALNFCRAGEMPHLKRLILSCVRLSAMAFFASHAPALETLHISNPMGPTHDEVILDLALPQLKHLTIDYCRLHARSNFALSLTRCPKLQRFQSYKMWFAYGPNYMLLPNCTRFELTRSEGTAQIEILFAPKLQMVNLSCCYELCRFRIWDFNKRITEIDVKSLNGKRNQGPNRAPEVWNRFMHSLEQRPELYDLSTLPQCLVSHFNVDLEQDSIAEAHGTRVYLTNEQVLFQA